MLDARRLERNGTTLLLLTFQDVTGRKQAEQTTSLLAAIVDSSDDAIVSKNLDGTITSWNRSAERLFGYTALEAIGQHITLIVPWERRSEEEDILRRLAQGERVDHFETMRKRKDGTTLDVSLTISPIRDAAGRVIGASKVARDVTERGQAQRALSEQARLLDLSNDAISIRDEADRVTYWNKAATQLYGFTREEALGRVTHELLQTQFPADLEKINQQLHRDEHWSGELVHTRKDGTKVIVISRWVLDRKAGNSWCILETNNDITRQKYTEKALRESEQRYRAMIDATPIMVWMSGLDKLCYYFNKSWLDFVGRTLEQELGDGWAKGVHPDDFDRCLQIYVSSFDARRPFEMQYRLRHHTGQYRWIFDHGVPRYAPDGTFEGYVGGCLDIHDQKEAEEKTRRAEVSFQLMRSQEEERRHIARELHDSAGQTLTVLGLSLAQLIENARASAPELANEAGQIEEIVQQLHREIRTTSYLLHPPLLDETGLNSAISWYVEGLLERSGLEVDLDISKQFGRLPRDMELMIFRLVQECLTNIHRHSESKTASIRLTRESNQITLDIRDAGKGMSAVRLAEVQSGRSGMGIRGMRERLRQFEGTMSIESNGSGTRVLASIPVPKAASSQGQDKAEPLQAAV